MKKGDTLLRMIGLLGVLLPFVLLFGSYLSSSTPMRPSISAYYHTDMGYLFVGIMLATGAFLISYQSDSNKSWAKWLRRAHVRDDGFTSFSGSLAILGGRVSFELQGDDTRLGQQHAPDRCCPLPAYDSIYVFCQIRRAGREQGSAQTVCGHNPGHGMHTHHRRTTGLAAIPQLGLVAGDSRRDIVWVLLACQVWADPR